MICVIQAHPYMSRSRTNRMLVDALKDLPNLDLRPLYDLYPDFDIDVAVEQRALEQARLIVWLHPLFWYSVPALLKHWIDKVLAYGWAYGEGGTALHGKHCLWVPTAGGDAQSYVPGGMHGHPFSSYVAPMEQTARFCGMHWETPFVVHDANSGDVSMIARHAAALVDRLSPWQQRPSAVSTEASS